MAACVWAQSTARGGLLRDDNAVDGAVVDDAAIDRAAVEKMADAPEADQISVPLAASTA
ncbi:MAG: hypothetical protein R2855_02670 [Thermomicrobiales bacterium]